MDENSSSERDALLGARRTPPPRYSSIDGEVIKQQGAPGNEVQVHGENVAPAHLAAGPSVFSPIVTNGVPPPQLPNQNNYGNPYHSGWYSFLPGPNQLYPPPPGLEHLVNLDELTITNRGSKYRIWHHDSHQLFTAKILNPRYCGGGIKGDADIKVLNNANLEVLSLCRTLDASGCCGAYDDAHVEVAFYPGHVVGVVQGSKMEYTIMNPSGDLLYLLEGQGFSWCRKGGYNIVTSERNKLGSIYMEKSSCCGPSSVMRLEFPSDLDIRSKALLMSAALSIRDLHWT